MSEAERPADTTEPTDEERSSRPPRDDLVRAVAPGPEFRAEGDGIGKLRGHFAVFDTWTEVDSVFEGHFIERIAPGAFKKAINDGMRGVQVLYDHGQDVMIGRKPLGPIIEVGEDARGAYYEVDLLDTSYNRDLEPGLRAGVYGSSFRFSVTKEDFKARPQRSSYNPAGLPERVVQEVRLKDIGPTAFPVYPDATASMRSMTDEFMVRKLQENPERSAALIESIQSTPVAARSDDPAPAIEPDAPKAVENALPADGAAETHSDEGSRSEPESPLNGITKHGQKVVEAIAEGMRSAQPDPPPVAAAITPTDPPAGGSSATKEIPTVNTIEERRSRVDEIDARRSEIHNEYGVAELPTDVQSEWDKLDEERSAHARAIEAFEQRSEALKRSAEKETNRVSVGQAPAVINRSQGHVPANVYAIEEYRSLSRTEDEMKQAMKDGAMRSVEAAAFAHPDADENKNKTHIERLLRADDEGKFAAHLLATGSPVYARAFGKMLAGKFLTGEEQRAVATVGSSQLADGGYAIPYQLDPTIILTSNGQTNPLRQIARVETLTGAGNTWKGVTSAGITVSRVAEESAVTATSPTLAQPSVTAQAVKAEIDFSIESDQDWPRLQSEMAKLLQDAKDAEEAEQFVNGNGDGSTGNPEGIVAGLAASSDVGTTGDGFDLEDIDRLLAALPDRFEPNARFMGHRAVLGRIESLDRAAGGGSVYRSLAAGAPATLLGYPRHNSSAMESDYTTSGNDILLFGDFANGFIIVDKVGMSIELDPHVRDTNGKWTGQRALLAIWRNNSMVLVDNAMRLLKVGVVTS